ncbi:sugar ABC transporter substrate-binding protein [Rathayibacter soli]|uniref:sugar ABC transporter substrate-binding protein n=1 Tax=Rathayibacter soli TaxID=3144168 RepID=UPI0027E4BB04|nr:sugar ABC transporter substrate-binding protein [Glaciibacter superstes]
MKKHNRGYRFVAVAAAVLMAVSGCTISSNSAGGSAGNKAVLTFWSYYTGTQATWLKDQVAKFDKANPGVTVNIVQTVGSQQDQKLLASVATGKTPDLFINNIVVDYPTLVGGGVMKDLTPYWNKYADKGQFPSGAVWKTNGKVYNLMSYTNLLGMFYNKDILSQYGITDPPKTLDELQSDMAKVAAGGTYKGIALSGAPTVEGAWLFAPQLLGVGVNYCNFTGNKVTTAFTRIADWAKAGYTPQATATWDQNASWQQFMTGKYAFAFNGNWQLGNVKTAAFKYGTAQYPATDGGKSQVYPGGEGFAIGAKSKHPDLAWKFLEQMVLSKQGGESVFAEAGSIPVRADVADIPAIKNDQYVQPFVTAAHDTGQWPNNTNTANMQTSLGKAVSAVISGQQTAEQGATSAIDSISAAIKTGGGTCK